MQIFLTYTDTPYRVFYEGERGLHISPTALSTFEDAHLVFAFWCHHALSDEDGWGHFLQLYEHYKKWEKQLPPNVTPILSIEDARILSARYEERMDMLSKWGIRTITPMWRGVHSLGGAYDTDEGLTPLGVKVCTLALERGIALDISHASRQSAEEILSLSRTHGIPPLASHSNFLGVHPHRRNLDDTLAKEVASLGGVIGISFVPSHLGGKEDLDAICAHLNYGCRLGLENALVLGTDYDGTDFLPYGLQGGIEDLYKLYSYLAQRGFSETFLEKLFYLNAHTYFSCKKDAQT